jgi:hypothetical protein
VTPDTATEDAVTDVLQPNPVPLVQISALAVVEQDPTANAVGVATPAVPLPITVFAASVAIDDRAILLKVFDAPLIVLLVKT